MALQDFTNPDASKWVTLGGVNRQGKPNPETFEGYYLGREESPSTFGDNKTKVTFKFQTKDGVVGVNGTSNLIRKMTDSEVNLQKKGYSALGAYTVIKYTGSAPSKKGAPTKLFTVQFDPEDTIDTNELNNDLDTALADDEAEEAYEAPEASVKSSLNTNRVAELLGKKSAKSAKAN